MPRQLRPKHRAETGRLRPKGLRPATTSATARCETRKTAAAGLNAVVGETLTFDFFRALADADRLPARRKARLARGDPTMSKLSRRRIANVR